MIPIEQQVADYERHAEAAIDLAIEYLQTHREVIKRQEVRRMCSIGEGEYGDSTWHRTPEQLAFEGLGEGCDLSFYLSVGIGQYGLVAMRKALGLDVRGVFEGAVVPND